MKDRLLSSTSMMFEEVAYWQICEYISSHVIFYDNQWEFRNHHSTELAALELVDVICNGLVIDIKLHLPISMQCHTISGTVLNTSRSYFTEPHKYVHYNAASFT